LDRYRKDRGDQGESLAVDFLRRNGVDILERNYRYSRYGEIDIIGRKDPYLIFFEVKSRSTRAYGGPLYSISENKKKTLRKIARHYLSCHPEFNTVDIICRFDLIAIMNGDISWIEDIIR